MKLIMPFSAKMQISTFRWYLNIILAGIIFCNAEAGRLLGIQTLPLHFSAVWPATGFSLAALLLFGSRAWPGVFVGNLLYNCVHLFLQHAGFIGPFVAALAISLGSLAQALLASAILRRYSSTGYFKTGKDVLLFLVWGGFLSCMIAPTVGVVTFYLYGLLPAANVAVTWLTFWIGDVMGVYVIAPLLIVWALRKIAVSMDGQKLEIASMAFLYLFLSWLYYYVAVYPAIYLFVPYAIWVSYRYGFRGATLALFFSSVTTIVITGFGHGSFVNVYPESALVALVMFLEIVLVTTALFMATIKSLPAQIDRTT